MNKEVTEDLDKVGSRGQYQKILGYLLFFAACEVNMLFFGPTFIYMNPSFNCSFAEGRVDESVACPRITQCTINNGFTITAALQLYCDRQFLRNVIQSSFAVGAILGLLLINYISDTRGRRIGMIIPQYISIISVCLTLSGGWFESVPLLVASQFFGGFGGFGLINAAFVIPGEYCDNELRQQMTVFVNYAWALTTLLIGLAYFFYNIWYKYLIVFMLIPFILILIATIYFFVESPYFLHQEQRWQEYVQSLKVIASYNNTQFNEKEISDKCKQYIAQPQEQVPFFSVICDSYFLHLVVLLSLINCGIEIFYIGKSYTLDLAGWQYGYNCILTGVTEFFGFFVLSMVVNFLPRKKGILVTSILMIIIGLIFISRTVVDNHTVQMIFFGIYNIIGTFTFTAIMLYQTQLFPSKVAATCLGIIDSVGQLGVFVAPYLVTLCINLQIHPFTLFSCVYVLIMILPLLLINDTRLHKHHEEGEFEIQQEKPEK